MELRLPHTGGDGAVLGFAESLAMAASRTGARCGGLRCGIGGSAEGLAGAIGVGAGWWGETALAAVGARGGLRRGVAGVDDLARVLGQRGEGLVRSAGAGAAERTWQDCSPPRSIADDC